MTSARTAWPMSPRLGGREKLPPPCLGGLIIIFLVFLNGSFMDSGIILKFAIIPSMALSEFRKAFFDYEILKRFTAGLELLGTEVKSVRLGKMNLQGAFITVRGGEVYLVNADIPAYQPKNAPQKYDALRPRKLLLSNEEIMGLRDAEGTKGLTIVPLSVYNKGRFLKLDLAIAKGKKKYDKRQTIKKRDVERDLKRTL